MGQSEDLTTRLANLIRGYTYGPSLVKEFLQNADDARATKLRVVLDHRRHPTPDGADPTEYDINGPALLLCNNKLFSDRDFDAIQNIGRSSKVADPLSTGRFGHGFNVAYNVTDYPQVLSGSRLLVFDPHRRHRDAKDGDRPGFDLRLSNTEDVDLFLLRPFSAGGYGGGDTHEGTIIRLPLRLPEQTATSSISPLGRTAGDIAGLLADLAAEASDLLLFLKNILTVRVEEVDEKGNRSVLCSVETQNPEEVTAGRNSLLQLVGEHGDAELLDELDLLPDKSLVRTWRHRLKIANLQKVRTETWLTTCGLFGGEAIRAAAEELRITEAKAVPWAGAAAKLATAPDGEERFEATEGRFFCFLPLPQPHGLPLHLHGFFDLDSSRTIITRQETKARGGASARGRWNETLLSMAVAPVAAELLSQMAIQEIENYYDAWPMPAGTLHDERRTFTEGLYRHLRQTACVATADEVWQPEHVPLPPQGRPQLQQPLEELGIFIPVPPLPLHAREGLKQAGAQFQMLDPACVRDALRVTRDVNCLPQDADTPVLRRPAWVAELHWFCARDASGLQAKGCLRGLPLVICSDGFLHTIGLHKPDAKSKVWIATKEQQELFPEMLHRFVDTNFQRSADVKPDPSSGLNRLDPPGVARLFALQIDPENRQSARGPLEGHEHEGMAWIARVLGYLSRNGNTKEHYRRDIVQALKQVPFVPDDHGNLLPAGQNDTPLLIPEKQDRTTGSLLASLGIPCVTPRSPLHRPLLQFAEDIERGELLSTPDGQAVVAMLEEQRLATGWPRLDDRTQCDLLRYLHRQDPDSWLNDEAKNTLRSWPIWRVSTSDHRTHLPLEAEASAFIAGDFTPPASDTSSLLLKPEHMEAESLLVSLGVERIQGDTYVRQHVLKAYDGLDAEERLRRLCWLRDEYEEIHQRLKLNDSDAADALEEDVMHADLLRTPHGDYERASRLYDPEAPEVVRTLPGIAVCVDRTHYQDDWAAWSKFFSRLGLRRKPSRDDLLRRCNQLAEAPWRISIEEEAKQVCDHLVCNWNFLARSEEGEEFRNELADTAFLPVRRSTTFLQDHPGAAAPEQRLFSGHEVASPENGFCVAGRVPVLALDCDREHKFLRSLRVPPDPKAIDVAGRLADLAEEIAGGGKSGKRVAWQKPWGLERAQQHLLPVIQKLGELLASSRVGGAERETDRTVRELLEQVPCVPRKSGLWPPSRCVLSTKTSTKAEPLATAISALEPDDKLNLRNLGVQETPKPEWIADLLLQARELLTDEKDAGAAVALLRLGLQSGIPREALAEAIRERQAPIPDRDQRLVSLTQLFAESEGVDTSALEELEGFHLVHPSLADLGVQAGVIPLDRANAKLRRPVDVLASGDTATKVERLRANLTSPELQRALRRLLAADGLQGAPDANMLAALNLRVVEHLAVDLMIENGCGVRFEAVSLPSSLVEADGSVWIQEGNPVPEEAIAKAAHAAIEAWAAKPVPFTHLEKILTLDPTFIDRYLNDKKVPKLSEEDEQADLDGEDADAFTTKSPPARTVSPHGTGAAVTSEGGTTAAAPASIKDEQPAEQPENHKASPLEPLVHPGTEGGISRQPAPGAAPFRADGQPPARRSRTPRGRAAPREVDQKAATAGKQTPTRSPQSPRQKPSWTGNAVSFVDFNSPSDRTQSDTAFDGRDPGWTQQIGDAAEEAVVRYEQLNGRKPERMQTNNPGYDIRSRGSAGLRHIEVKGLSGAWDHWVFLSPKQFLDARRKLHDDKNRTNFWLYVVEHATDPKQRRIWRIYDPFGKANKYALDHGWRQWAETSDEGSGENPTPGDPMPAQGAAPAAPPRAKPPQQPLIRHVQIPEKLSSGKKTGRFRELRVGWRWKMDGESFPIVDLQVTAYSMNMVIKKRGQKLLVQWRSDDDMKRVITDEEFT